MDPTVEFLWSRRQRQLPAIEAQAWAITLLQRDVKSDAILRLAAERKLHWQDEAALIHAALKDIGKAHLEEERVLLLAYEQGSVEDYLCGTIDGLTLVQRGCDLFYRYANDQNEFDFWIGLAEEVHQYGGGPLECLALEKTLREALREQGRFTA
jgi:hypothetical protein